MIDFLHVRKSARREPTPRGRFSFRGLKGGDMGCMGALRTPEAEASADRHESDMAAIKRLFCNGYGLPADIRAACRSLLFGPDFSAMIDWANAHGVVRFSEARSALLRELRKARIRIVP